MKFNADGICELESITSVDECEAYKAFLRAEEDRHSSEMVETLRYAARLNDVDTVYTHAAAEFYQSAAVRHQDDLDAIDRLIPRIDAHKAKLEGKCST
jgi:hypothetical protein